GNINKKLATLMQTSESSIKRLIRVGDNAPEELGLIHHGEKSFKQVLDKIKLDRLEERSKIKKETENILPKQTIPTTLSIPPDDETEDDVLNRNGENLSVEIPVYTEQEQK